MKTIYIDHNILACEKNWPELSRLFSQNTDLRLAISDWNLLEIICTCDKPQAIRRAELIDSLNPLWIMDRLFIQQHEVKQFIWLNYFNYQAESFCVFTEYLSVLLSHYLGADAPLGCTAKKWVENIHGNMPLKDIYSSKNETVRALKTLQNTDTKKKKDSNADVFRTLVFSKVPDRYQENRPIIISEKEKIVKYCYDNKDKFYLDCPAMAVEDKLCDIRTQDHNRKPKESDAVDLQHSVLALAYCDAFITGDGYIFRCVKQAERKLKPLRIAAIYRDIQAYCNA